MYVIKLWVIKLLNGWKINTRAYRGRLNLVQPVLSEDTAKSNQQIFDRSVREGYVRVHVLVLDSVQYNISEFIYYEFHTDRFHFLYKKMDKSIFNP